MCIVASARPDAAKLPEPSWLDRPPPPNCMCIHMGVNSTDECHIKQVADYSNIIITTLISQLVSAQEQRSHTPNYRASNYDQLQHVVYNYLQCQ